MKRKSLQVNKGPSSQSTTRRKFLKAGAAGLAAAGLGPKFAAAVGPAPDLTSDPDIILTNGRIYTMDNVYPAQATVATSASMRNGRFVEVGNVTQSPGPNTQVIDLQGRSVLPGLIDGHNHIVLVANRPGFHLLFDDVRSLDDVFKRIHDRLDLVGMTPAQFRAHPDYGVVTAIGTMCAAQMTSGLTGGNTAGNRVPTSAELSAAPNPALPSGGGFGSGSDGYPIFLFPGSPNTITNSGTSFTVNWVADSGGGPATLAGLRSRVLNPTVMRRNTLECLNFYASLGITTQGDKNAFYSEDPNNAIANVNYYTMYYPFLQLWREGKLPVRMRLDYLHQDTSTLATVNPRLRNSWQFFGDDMLASSSNGEFTSSNGQNLDSMRAFARAGWSAEDHIVAGDPNNLITARENVFNGSGGVPGIDYRKNRWIIAHVPVFTNPEIARWNALGGGVWTGWGASRTGTNVGPPYRNFFGGPNGDGVSTMRMAYHSDGGDFTTINPWWMLYTVITGFNMQGQLILGNQNLTRHEAVWLATAAEKWFLREDALGTIEPGNYADFIVLDRHLFGDGACPDIEIPMIRPVLTVVGGKVVFNNGFL